MPLDAMCMSGLVHELSTGLTGSKIDKIYQPAREEIILGLRAPSGNVKLLLSASPNHPRAQLTQLSRENPDKPPMFCMLLRKHLTGGRIVEISQPPLERIIRFRLDTIDELGDRVERTLVLEAMGRHANLILLDNEGRIMDCLRRVDSDISSRRQVLPGMFYRAPDQQDKQDPTVLSREELETLLDQAPEEAQADRWLLDTFNGLSPLICRELAQLAGDATDFRLNQLGEHGRALLLDELEKLLAGVKEHTYVPTMITIDGKPKDFSFLPITQYGQAAGSVSYPTFSRLMDEFYEQRENLERVKQKGQDLIRSVTNARDRTARKIANQEKELEATYGRERLREQGDIITSSMHTMSKGMTCLHTVDFYDPECREIDIKLDPLLTPQQNAAKYYKEYNKAKKAEEMLTIQLAKGRQDLEYLNSVLENITFAEGERDLGEIRQELTDTGYLRRLPKAKAHSKRLASKPMEFRSSTGMRISVGKNNIQNDTLTCKQAYKSDIWFHTQKIHGSHVILWTEGGDADLQSLNEAAMLAAWFSQARDGVKVPVDYTQVRYVKKLAGANPGMVTYTNYETAWVQPDPELAKKLRTK